MEKKNNYEKESKQRIKKLEEKLKKLEKKGIGKKSKGKVPKATVQKGIKSLWDLT